MTVVTRIPGNRNLTATESITGCLAVGVRGTLFQVDEKTGGRSWKGLQQKKRKLLGVMNRSLSLW